MYRTIMVPLDGSDLAERALPFARQMVKASNAHLLLIRVVPPTPYPAAERDVDRGKAMSDAEAARTVNADIIAMSTHGRTGIPRLVMGSVAAKTIQNATVPMLLVRPAAMRQLAHPRPTASAGT